MTSESQRPLLERIERALVVLALLIERDGEAYVPFFERVESELERLRRAEGTKDRARRLLDSYSRSGERKAITDKNLSLSSSGGPSP
jgi:hypothetical protein